MISENLKLDWQSLYRHRRSIRDQFGDVWELPVKKRYHQVLSAYGSSGISLLEVGAGDNIDNINRAVWPDDGGLGRAAREAHEEQPDERRFQDDEEYHLHVNGEREADARVEEGRGGIVGGQSVANGRARLDGKRKRLAECDVLAAAEREDAVGRRVVNDDI